MLKPVEMCHQCRHRGPVVDRRAVCEADPERRNIIEHAEHLGCPLGFFDGKPLEKRIPLAGDLVAALTAKFGIDRAAKFAAKLAGKADCGCDKRRAWLNRLDRRIRGMVG